MMAEWLKAGGYQGAENDMAVSFFKDNGAISSVRNDAEKQFLLSKGVAPGQLNDMWFRYLGSLGYLGALNDRFNKYYNTPISTAIHDAFSSGVLPAAYASINRTGLATRTGPDGLVGYGPHNLLWPSSDVAAANWQKLGVGTGSVPVVTSGAGIGPSGQSVCRVQIARGVGTGGGDYSLVGVSVGSTPAGITDARVLVKSYSGADQSVMCYLGTAAGTTVSVVTVGADWVELIPAEMTTTTVGGTTLYIGSRGGAYGGAANIDVLIAEAQVNLGPLCEFVETTTAAHYPPRITYDPTTLACLGMPVEGQASDTAQDTGLNTLVTAAQNRTVTATPWTVQFHGTGTVTLSGAHTAVITGTGLYQQASLTFTPSAGTLMMTPSGDVKNLDLINQAYPSSSIVNTTTGSAVRPADQIVLSGSAFTERFGPIQAAGAGTLVVEFVAPPAGASGCVVSAGLSTRFFYRNPGVANWYAYDGTNTFLFGATSSGATVKMALTFNASNASAAMGGVVTATPAPHNGAFLTGTELLVGNTSVGGAYPLNSTIARISYIPRYITGVDLAALTA